MDKKIIAIPSALPGGLDAGMGMHFGHCEIYTIAEVEDGKVASVRTLPPIPHQQGGCLAPVNYLAGEGVNVLLAGGMGMRPLMGFNQAGITVYYDAEHPIVGDAVRAVAAGEAPIMSADQACNHHH